MKRLAPELDVSVCVLTFSERRLPSWVTRIVAAGERLHRWKRGA